MHVPWARPDSGFTVLFEQAALTLVREMPVAAAARRILQRWNSDHSNARLEGLNGLFQAARARARSYRNATTFATVIYLIAAPLGNPFTST